jgi:hypothetical protein
MGSGDVRYWDLSDCPGRYGRIGSVIRSESTTFPVTGGSFWRDRTVDLLLVASAGCTPTRHNG